MRRPVCSQALPFLDVSEREDAKASVGDGGGLYFWKAACSARFDMDLLFPHVPKKKNDAE